MIQNCQVISSHPHHLGVQGKVIQYYPSYLWSWLRQTFSQNILLVSPNSLRGGEEIELYLLRVFVPCYLQPLIYQARDLRQDHRGNFEREVPNFYAPLHLAAHHLVANLNIILLKMLQKISVDRLLRHLVDIITYKSFVGSRRKFLCPPSPPLILNYTINTRALYMCFANFDFVNGDASAHRPSLMSWS